MKKTVILLLFIFNYLCLHAQNARFHQSPDTVNITKPGKVKKDASTGMVSTYSIMQNLINSGEFSKLLTAIRTAGMGETLNSKGPVTILAPPNIAFDKIKGKMDTLLEPTNQFQLINLISYHALPGFVKLSDIKKKIKAGKGKATLLTVSGNFIFASFDSNHNIILTDEFGGQSTISEPDIKQANGLIHIVTNVLIPKYKLI